MADLPRKRNQALYAKTLGDLRSLSDEELIRQHDSLIETGGYTAGLDYYLGELARREADRQTRTMLKLTWTVLFLTVVNVGAVIVDVVCS